MVNNVILIGRVGADPEVRALEGGGKVVRLRLATTERVLIRKSGQLQDHTEWHSVVLWHALADMADKYVRKGAMIYVEGHIRYRDWVDKQGNKRYGVDIVCDQMRLLSSRSDSTTDAESADTSPKVEAADFVQEQAKAAPTPIPIDDPDGLPF